MILEEVSILFSALSLTIYIYVHIQKYSFYFITGVIVKRTIQMIEFARDYIYCGCDFSAALR